MAGQIYAEFQIPKNQTHRYPIVMVHGAIQTGTNFTGTPDGRMGWAEYFLRPGYAVYVIDQPGRARAGYDADSEGPQAFPDLKPPSSASPRPSAPSSGRRRACTRNGRERASRAIRCSTSSICRKCPSCARRKRRKR